MRFGVSCAQSNDLDDGNDIGFARLRYYEQNLEFYVHVENSSSMAGLEPPFFCPKQIFCDLSSLWLGPQSKKLQNYGGFVRKATLGRELCPILWCKKYICARPCFEAKLPLVPKDLLVICLLYESYYEQNHRFLVYVTNKTIDF